MEEDNNKASVYFQNGCRFMELNEFQNAINEFDKLISIAPSFDAYKKKYECLTKLGAYQSKKEKRISPTPLTKNDIDTKNLISKKNPKDENTTFINQNETFMNIKKVKGKYLAVVNEQLGNKFSKNEIAIACGYFEMKNKIKVPLVEEYLDESSKSVEQLIQLKNKCSTEDYYLTRIELGIFRDRLCEYDGEEHGEFVYVPKRIVENSQDWNYESADFDNFDMEYVANEEGLEDFESYISEKYPEEELKRLDMEKEFLKFNEFSEPMMIQYLSMMNYVDHHLKTKYDERIENEDVAEAHGIRYSDIHEKSFF